MQAMNPQLLHQPPPSANAGAQRPEFAALDADTLRAALTRMHLIRKFEETAEASYMRGLIHGTMHLSVGQEASAVGAILPDRQVHRSVDQAAHVARLGGLL